MQIPNDFQSRRNLLFRNQTYLSPLHTSQSGYLPTTLFPAVQRVVQAQGSSVGLRTSTHSNNSFSFNVPKGLSRCESGINFFGGSPFAVRGQFLQINPNDALYHSGYWDIRNFSFDQTFDMIADGGYGKVYRARHAMDPTKSFAVKKIYKPSLRENGSNESYVSREISIQMNLNHPNIVRLFTFFSTPTDVYMVMEDCNGGTLYDKICQDGPFDEVKAFRYFIQVVNAMKFLHQNNIAHRDIKPENILFDSRGHVKLCDFGWAIRIGQGERRKTFCGTYEYMSPEMIKDKGYDKAIDVWALGILLYEMLHGYSPFRTLPTDMVIPGKEHRTIFNKIVTQNYIISPTLSAECINLLRNLLFPDGSRRITVDQIYTHPWVRKFEPYSSQILSYEENSVANLQSTALITSQIKTQQHLNNMLMFVV